MADLKKFTTTLIQLHFSSHKNRFPFQKENKKRKTAVLLAGEGNTHRHSKIGTGYQYTKE